MLHTIVIEQAADEAAQNLISDSGPSFIQKLAKRPGFLF